MSQTLGDRIRRMRRAQGLSQRELAEIVGVTKAAVTLWETGRSKNLKNEHLWKLARALDTDEEYLIFGPSRKPATRTHRNTR